MLLEKKSNIKLGEKMSVLRISDLKYFSVDKIFDCGQCFRFNKVQNSLHESEYSGIAFGKFISFAQDGNDLYVYNCTEEEFEGIWKHYLALDTDYSFVENEILSASNSLALRCAIEYSRGIRILNQESWESVCSFIISQNNNIPRIKKIIENLSARCGTPVELPQGAEDHICNVSSNCAFPTPEQILELGIDGLVELKTGFRAKYIYDAAQKAVSGELDFDFIGKLSTKEAIEYLCQVKGIGPKVASCALLFGFEKYDAFPIDVWIKRVIAKYFISEETPAFEPKQLGEYAGIAQQFLFYYERYGGYKDFE